MRLLRTLRLAALAALTLAAAPLAHAVPTTLTVQGQLTNDAGVARDGTYALTISLWTSELGGARLFTQTLPDVEVTGGLFDLIVGADALAPLTAELFKDASQVWLQVEVDAGPGVAADEAPLPRQPLTATPFAFASHHAETAGGLTCASGCVSIGELDFDPATQRELDDALATVVRTTDLGAILAPYARTTDLRAYATVSQLASELAALVTRSELATALTGLVTPDGLATALAPYARRTELPTRLDGLGGGTVSSPVSAPAFLQAGQPVCDASGNCGRSVDDFSCADGQTLARSGGRWVCAAGAAAPPVCTGAFRALQFDGSRWSCVDLRGSTLSGGNARGFEVVDAWGFAWDGQMRAPSTWANASAACASDGGRLPTVTELTRVSHGATGTGEVSDGLETNWHWAITPFIAGTRYMAVRLDTGANSQSAQPAELQRYRCVWPDRTSPAFDGNKCHGPPGAECFASTAEGGRFHADKLDRPAVSWWVAVNECAFYNARVARAVTYAELIQAGLPNGSGPGSSWIWTADRGGFNGTSFLFVLLRWTGVQTAFDGTHTAFVDWNYNAEGHTAGFRCVGLKDDLGPYKGTVTDEFVDAGRTRLKSTTTESALEPWVATLDRCFAAGGHIPSLADWTALVQAGLPRPNNAEYSHTSDAEFGTSGGQVAYNAVVTWSQTAPAFTAVYTPFSTWASRANNQRGRCVWYPLDPTYAGPSEATCNGGCFTKVIEANGQTHRFWVDRFDRTPAKFGDAIRACHQAGGHLMSFSEYAELIRAGLPNGSNTWSWTSDWARYDHTFTVRWTATAAGWDNVVNANVTPTATTTTAPYRCLWSNELNE